jgi:hypothetical protein
MVGRTWWNMPLLIAVRWWILFHLFVGEKKWWTAKGGIVPPLFAGGKFHLGV